MLTPPAVPNQKLPSLSSRMQLTKLLLNPSFSVKCVKDSPLYMLTSARGAEPDIAITVLQDGPNTIINKSLSFGKMRKVFAIIHAHTSED